MRRCHAHHRQEGDCNGDSQGARSRRKDLKKPAILLLVVGGYFWLTHAALYPPLPSADRAILFYANQLRSDLKRVVLCAIGSAQTSISLQIYGLTDPDVIAALQRATLRGVAVHLYFDPRGSRRLPFGTPIRAGGLMHRKILVVDGVKTFIGTTNFTTPSLKIHDNILVGLYGRDLATHFTQCIDSCATFDIGGTELTTFLLPDFEGKAIDCLCQALESATESIELAMFTLTHPRLVASLKDAAGRGVKVSVAIDPYTCRGASKKAMSALQGAGIEIYSGLRGKLLHHKCALIDRTTFVMGSANWTGAAFAKNQDCLLIFRNLTAPHKKRLSKLWQAVANGCEKR